MPAGAASLLRLEFMPPFSGLLRSSPISASLRWQAVQQFDSRRERQVGWYPFQAQNTGKVASHIENPWSKSVGVPMLLDTSYLAQGFLWSKEPGKVFPDAGIASLLCAPC
jgi:hypothetical protein